MSLEVLKGKIERVRYFRSLPLIAQLGVGSFAAERDAWQAAYEFQGRFLFKTLLTREEAAELQEGTRLIDEVLKR